jgi:lysophospholipid acyltransferase (LPLAT)-like uncharacterized protein
MPAVTETPPPAKRDTEVRSSRKTEWVGRLAGWAMRLNFMTLRVKYVDRCGVTAPEGIQGPVIVTLWHNRIFACVPAWKAKCGARRVVALTSASHDGAIVERALGVCGIGAVRGSSSRRGAAALVGLRRALRDGLDVAITPDGPRGPRYAVQPGIVKLAQSSGAPIVAVHATYENAWRARTWDGFAVPKPFSRVTVTFDEAIAVPRRLDDDAFEQWRKKIESLLRSGVDDLDFEPKKKKSENKQPK